MLSYGQGNFVRLWQCMVSKYLQYTGRRVYKQEMRALTTFQVHSIEKFPDHMTLSFHGKRKLLFFQKRLELLYL